MSIRMGVPPLRHRSPPLRDWVGIIWSILTTRAAQDNASPVRVHPRLKNRSSAAERVVLGKRDREKGVRVDDDDDGPHRIASTISMGVAQMRPRLVVSRFCARPARPPRAPAAVAAGRPLAAS